jgi:hypothetical protein
LTRSVGPFNAAPELYFRSHRSIVIIWLVIPLEGTAILTIRRRFILRDTVFENQVIKENDGFNVVFQLQVKSVVVIRLISQETTTKEVRVFTDSPSILIRDEASKVLASNLLNSATGDIIFEIQGANEEKACLYATIKLLITQSDYFKASEISTFGDAYVQGLAPEWNQTAVDFPGPRGHPEGPIISVNEFDFTTMHNLLYYLYTGCVNLHCPDPDAEVDNPDGYPNEVDAFQLFLAANMYLIEDLESRCFHYLRSTCTSKNITERLFDHPQCANHDKILTLYLDYVNQNFEEIKMTEEWEGMLLAMKDCTPEVIAHQSKLLLEISKMTFGVKK